MSRVYRGVHSETLEPVAIKVIDEHSSAYQADALAQREIHLLDALRHKNLATMLGHGNEGGIFYIVFPLYKETLEAKTLLSPYPRFQDFWTEVGKPLLDVLGYAFSRNFIHRDLKPSNIMFDSAGDLKLIDFGFAKNYKTTELKSQVGSPWYIAPEILKGKPYTQACDNWSLGVMLYIMLFAEPPFKGRNTQQILQSITSSYLNLSDSKHSRISPEMLHLLSILLEKNPENRAKLSDALHSNCFYPIYHIPEFYWGVSEKKKIVKKIQKAKQQSRFAHEAIKIMVKVFSNTPEFKEYMNAFFLCDLLSRGVLAQDEIKQLFADADMVIDERKDFKKLGCLSFKNKTAVTCTEFIAGMLDRNFFQDQPKLKLVFSRFDLENKGYITAENIKSSFHRFGYELSNETISDMVKEFGADNEGNIRFDLFEKVSKANIGYIKEQTGEE